jgi:hypothetical protein
MDGFDWLDVTIDMFVLAAVIGFAIWLFRHREKQPNWDKEEATNPRGAQITYSIFFAMGLLFSAMGAWDARLSTLTMGLILTVWSGWRWVRLRRRRSPNDAERKLSAE